MIKRLSWLIFSYWICMSSDAKAEFIPPQEYDGTYKVVCKTMEMNIFGSVSGPNGLDMKTSQTIPLLCGDNPAQKELVEATMANVLEQIVAACEQVSLLNSMIDCLAEASKMMDAIMNSNLMSAEIVPDQVEFKVAFPDSITWYLGFGYLNTQSQWLDSDQNIVQEQSRPFIFSNRSGEFFNFELPFNNIAQLIPGCRMVQTATIAGKLSLANLYDGNPLTTDLTSQLRSDTSITCARHFGGDKYSANMGVKFRGAVDGERL